MVSTEGVSFCSWDDES